jgi:hypothetical protein
MCLYYNDKQMRSTDFTRDSMYMSIACYGEIASGMFVLFLPVVPKFFTHLKTASSFYLISNKRTLVEEDAGGASRSRGDVKRKSLFHISYTQKESEEKLAISVTSTVIVKSELAQGSGGGTGIGIEMKRREGV